MTRRSSAACRRICTAPDRASVAMMPATTTSGQPVPVPNTPRAATSTATLPITSLRVQSFRPLLKLADQAEMPSVPDLWHGDRVPPVGVPVPNTTTTEGSAR